MNGLMVIDEINEHITKAISGIPEPPKPFNLTDLIIDGYERTGGKANFNYGNTTNTRILSVVGEGYVNYAIVGIVTRIKIYIDSKLIYNGYNGSANWIGVCYDGMVKCAGNGSSNAFIIAGPTISSMGVSTRNIDKVAPDYLIKLNSSNPTCTTLCTVPAPIKFNKSFEVYLQGQSSGDGSTSLVYDYYLKTGGGN